MSNRFDTITTNTLRVQSFVASNELSIILIPSLMTPNCSHLSVESVNTVNTLIGVKASLHTLVAHQTCPIGGLSQRT